MKTLIHYLILLFICSTSTLSNAQEADLKLNLKQGDTFYLNNNIDQTITQYISGVEMIIHQNSTYSNKYQVIEVLPNNDYNIMVTYKRVAHKQNSSFSNINYDSDNPNAEITEDTYTFAALRNQSFSFICNPKGKVSSINGMDAIITKLIASNPKTLNEEEKTELKARFKAEFGDDTMKATLTDLLSVYPQNEIAIGEKWLKTSSINTGIGMTIDYTFTLNNIEDSIAKVSIDATLTPKTDTKPIKYNGSEMSYNMKGTQTGDLTLDMTSGLTKTCRLTQNMKGKMTMSGGTLPTPVVIPMEITTIITNTMQKE
jgi:hypothetical protein